MMLSILSVVCSEILVHAFLSLLLTDHSRYVDIYVTPFLYLVHYVFVHIVQSFPPLYYFIRIGICPILYIYNPHVHPFRMSYSHYIADTYIH